MKIRIYFTEIFHLKGRVLQRMERLDESQQAWSGELSESEKMSERRMRWQILEDLATVADSEYEANEFRKSARQIATYIADNSGSEERMRSFLNRPEVPVTGS